MATHRLDGHIILLVEDEPLISVEIQSALEEAGGSVCPAYTVQEALDLLPQQTFTAAILDYRLQGGTADDLCRQLTERRIPFVIYSGYTNVEGECSKWEIVAKPAEASLLVTHVVRVIAASASPGAL
jgi:DNA-binding response OmpR family regulator